MIEIGVLAGIGTGLLVVILRPWLPVPFTADHAVRALTSEVLWVVAALQPLAAIVFVLDGILIGAGDSRYLAMAMLAATAIYAVVLGSLAAAGTGLVLLWLAFAFWILLRAVGLLARFVTDRWVVLGTVSPGGQA
jgi:Na+-driven multidrug efflux pump